MTGALFQFRRLISKFTARCGVTPAMSRSWEPRRGLIRAADARGRAGSALLTLYPFQGSAFCSGASA